MMRWLALVPIKFGTSGKSRLATCLSLEERARLSAHMADHVLAVLAATGNIAAIAILSGTRPKGWEGDWVEDKGRGLNEEITNWWAANGDAPKFVIHADLPLLRVDDVEALLFTAEQRGIALATDRPGEGTNALAVADGRAFSFKFGADSRRLHAEQVTNMPVLERIGLAADMDTPDDLRFAQGQGYCF